MPNTQQVPAINQNFKDSKGISRNKNNFSSTTEREMPKLPRINAKNRSVIQNMSSSQYVTTSKKNGMLAAEPSSFAAKSKQKQSMSAMNKQGNPDEKNNSDNNEESNLSERNSAGNNEHIIKNKTNVRNQKNQQKQQKYKRVSLDKPPFTEMVKNVFQ